MTVNGAIGSTLTMTAPNPTTSYVDVDIDAISVTSAQQVVRLFDPLLGAGGLLRTFPQMMKITANNTSNTPGFYFRFHVDKIVLNLNFVGSSSNAVAAGDLYNRIRANCWETDLPYSSTAYPVFDVDNQVDWRWVRKHHLDHVATLTAGAYDSTSGFPASATQNIKISIPINRTFEAFSSATVSGLPSVMDTREGNLLLSVVADSSVLPHPSWSGSARLYYRQLTM